MDTWMKRHEPKVFWGGLALFIFYVYFIASVECLNYNNCWIASADLADAVLRFFGTK